MQFFFSFLATKFSAIADPGATRTRTSRKAAPQPPSAGSTNPAGGSSGMCVGDSDITSLMIKPLLDAAAAPPHSRARKPAFPVPSMDTSAQGVF